MREEWPGYYLDGRSAVRRTATVRIGRDGLQIRPQGGAILWWPYPEIRQTQGSYSGEQVRFERGGAAAEVLLIPDPAFLESVHQIAPGLRGRFHDPSRRRARLVLIPVAAGVTAVLVAALYLWGIPALAAVLAARVPVAWEERLGEAVIDQLAAPEKRCTETGPANALGEILRILTAPLPKIPYTLRLIVVDDKTFNALAVPGGYIVVYRGLLERTRSAEELAGVLAHEVQHILLRHTTRTLIQNASTGLLLAALAGDMSRIMGYGLESARTLGMLRYSRRQEEEADAAGMVLLRAAGIDPDGMISFFETLRRREVAGPKVLSYLSTHPSTEDRIQKLKSLTGRKRFPSVRLLPGHNWEDVKKICAATGRPGKGG